MLKLSICIPTYNREKFLPDALNSILKQINDNNKDKIEICISDNASEDNTKELINGFQKKSIIPIIYHRNDINQWADYNFIKVIEIAHWEYCWWLGSDDIIEDWGIDIVLENLEKYKNLSWIIVNVKNRTFDLKNITRKIPDVAYWKYKNIVKINNNDTFTDFFDYLWYISWQIVNRKYFIEVTSDEWEEIKRWFNAYVHIYIISKIFLKYNNFLYISEEIVWWRAWNDSFVEKNPNGIIKRMYIDINWYRDLANNLFEKKYTNKILTKISTVHIRAAVLWIKFSNLNFKTKWHTYMQIIKEYWYLPIFWIKTVPFIIIPEFILRIIQKTWRKYFLVIK